MKAIVTEIFLDKFTGEQYEVGTEVDFDEDRIAELENRGLVKADKVEKPKGGRRVGLKK